MADWCFRWTTCIDFVEQIKQWFSHGIRLMNSNKWFIGHEIKHIKPSKRSIQQYFSYLHNGAITVKIIINHIPHIASLTCLWSIRNNHALRVFHNVFLIWVIFLLFLGRPYARNCCRFSKFSHLANDLHWISFTYYSHRILWRVEDNRSYPFYCCN